MRATARRLINASPSRVYDHIRALDRMPERSPEADRFEWLGGTPGEVGASFRGWNRTLGIIRWWTQGWITEAERPRRFAFETSTIYGDREERTNRWQYDLEADGNGTLVIERLQTLRLPIHLKLLGPLLALRWLQIRVGMGRTLRRLAQECEVSSSV